MTATRGTSNTNDRGSAADRRARRAWLLATFNPELGLSACRCFSCAAVLDADSLEVDRVLPGALGGRYTRGNIRPICSTCNIKLGNALRGQLAQQRKAIAALCAGCRLAQ